MLAFINNLVSGDAALAVATLVLLGTVVVNIILAFGVWSDALRFVVDENRQLSLLPSWGWALATLVTGLLGATSYWLMHRSTLRRD